MKNLKYIIIGFVVADILIIVGVVVFLFGSQKDRCLDNGGMWYQDSCITKSSTPETLKKVGIIEELKNESVEIMINYPVEILNYPEIFDHLKKKIETIKTDNGFMNLEELDIDTASFPWQLNVDMDNFTIAGDLASILGYVFTYTGGAHPNHFFFSVNFDTYSQEIISFGDLFEDESRALGSISRYVIDELKKEKSERVGEKIEHDEFILTGASANLENYSIFVFVPDNQKKYIAGVKFVFPPYQVGPYAEGTYEVVVPGDVYFDYLESDVVKNFAITRPDPSLRTNT